jgi:hypothetical protein
MGAIQMIGRSHLAAGMLIAVSLSRPAGPNITMNGGNDGNNMIIPLDDAEQGQYNHDCLVSVRCLRKSFLALNGDSYNVSH